MGYGLASAIGFMLLAIYLGGKGLWIWLLGALYYFAFTREKRQPQPKRMDHDADPTRPDRRRLANRRD